LLALQRIVPILCLLNATISAAIAPGEFPIDELKWLTAGSNRLAALTLAPAECLTRSKDPSQAAQISLGRIAFRSPVLLGGIAARSGMSCDSCHRNGHDNPHFSISGVSDKPGTVDVTGSLFSLTRDDGVFNPVPIPDLVDAATEPPFGSILPMGELRSFLRVVIVDEFQGSSPSMAILEGLLAYVNALRSSACPQNREASIDADQALRDLESTYDAIDWSLNHQDAETAEFALLSLRASLGRVHQRVLPGEAVAEQLLKISVALTPVRSKLKSHPVAARAALQESRRSMRTALRVLIEAPSKSFYDPETLGRALDETP